MIEFKNVYIQYVNEFYTLYDFNCTIKNNTLFIGDFYSGTNSIMRILSKIDKNYKGEVFFDEQNLKEIKDKCLNISYLPQIPCVFKFKSMFYNLYYPLKIRKISKNDVKNKISSILNELNLNFLNKKIRKMNNSELKILCLIRALLREPKYVLLENFFEDLQSEYFLIANEILKKFNEQTLFIACEKQQVENEFFKEFKIIKLSK